MDAVNPTRPVLKPVITSSLDGDRSERVLASEMPVAIVFDGTSAAVMLATPQDLEDFAFGFAVTEGFLTRQSDISAFEVVPHRAGIEARFWLQRHASVALAARRRSMAGPVGCGLCGLESLDAAARSVPNVEMGPMAFSVEELTNATTRLRAHQPLHDRTRAVHSAGFLVPGEGVVAAREDVGRHNAVDKLIGGLLRAGADPRGGAITLTSRISVELVQKSAMAGCCVIIAVSSPTAYAVGIAQAAGITLIQSRHGKVTVFTHPERLAWATNAHDAGENPSW